MRAGEDKEADLPIQVKPEPPSAAKDFDYLGDSPMPDDEPQEVDDTKEAEKPVTGMGESIIPIPVQKVE